MIRSPYEIPWAGPATFGGLGIVELIWSTGKVGTIQGDPPSHEFDPYALTLGLVVIGIASVIAYARLKQDKARRRRQIARNSIEQLF